MLLIGVLVPVLLVHSAAATTSGHKVLPVLLLVCDSTPAASASVEGITDALNGSLAFDGYMLETYQVHSVSSVLRKYIYVVYSTIDSTCIRLTIATECEHTYPH